MQEPSLLSTLFALRAIRRLFELILWLTSSSFLPTLFLQSHIQYNAMNSQQIILKELAKSWEDDQPHYSPPTSKNNQTKSNFVLAPKSHESFIKISGWHQPKTAIQEKKIVVTKKSFSPFANDLSQEKIRAHFPDEVLKINSLKPSIVMLGSPMSVEKLKNQYYIDEKERGRFCIEENQQRKKKGKIYVKKEEKLKTNRSNNLSFRIREKSTRLTNAQFRSTKNTAYRHPKSHRLQALKIV